MDLVDGKISKHIKTIALPASVGFFFHTMFNVTDTYFAGTYSVNGLAALSLSFPIFFIIIALGTGIGTGTTALIANSIGEKDYAKGSKYSLQSISYTFILSIGLTILGLIFAPSLFMILGAKGEYLSISISYINIIILGSIFFLLNSVLNSTLNAQGDTKTFRNVLIAGFFLNILLDPWFMYGWLGFPAFGIAGLALATVIIEIGACSYMFYKVSKTKVWDKFKTNDFIPEKRIYADITKQGFPASLNMLTVALGIFIITYFISGFGEESVAAYGIATRIEQIALIPLIGLNIALLSIAGQNNGAKKYERVKEAWHTTLRYGFFVSLIGTILVYAFMRPLIGFFTDDPKVIEVGVDYLQIAAFAFFLYTILFQTVSLLQALKKPYYAMALGVTRQLILPTILFPLLIKSFKLGLYGVWIGVFIIVFLSAMFTLWYGRQTLNKIIADAK